MKAGCRARGRGLVQFPRSFVLKCAWRGSAHAPTIVPEASIPQVVTPTGQDDGCDFSVGFIARRCVGRGRGLTPQGTSGSWEGRGGPGGGGSPWPGCSSSLLGLHRWFSESRPVMPGYDKATWPWAPLPPPSGGGVPETFGGLAEAGRRRNLSCRNNDESCLLKKLPFKKRK